MDFGLKLEKSIIIRQDFPFGERELEPQVPDCHRHRATTAEGHNGTPAQPQPHVKVGSRNGGSPERSSGERKTRETASQAVAWRFPYGGLPPAHGVSRTNSARYI